MEREKVEKLNKRVEQRIFIRRNKIRIFENKSIIVPRV